MEKLLFQTILFSISTQLNAKTVLLQTIQFNLNTQFSSIWSIDRTSSDATTPGQSDIGAITMKGYSVFPKAPALLKPHHQIV